MDLLSSGLQLTNRRGPIVHTSSLLSKLSEAGKSKFYNLLGWTQLSVQFSETLNRYTNYTNSIMDIQKKNSYMKEWY